MADTTNEGRWTLAQADARRRVTLPSGSGIKAGDPMRIEVLDDGRILITPIVAIPKHQLWAWKPEVLERVSKALSDPGQPTRIETEEDLGALARSVGVDPESLDKN